MSFLESFNRLPVRDLVERSLGADESEVSRAIHSAHPDLAGFAAMLSPAGAGMLEALCRRSQQVTHQRFGKTIRLFAPLYLSNECINNCAYCGFSRDNPILRVTLSEDEVDREALELRRQGFRNILLVAGEHPKFVSNGYLASCVRRMHRVVPSVSLEVGPMETDEYVPMVEAGADGLVAYQETYDSDVYARMHTAGPKKDFDWRLRTPERAYAAGFRRLGIGALFGLSDWRLEAISVAAHAQYLLRHCWKSQVTVSFPRLRPCAGEFQPLTLFRDRELVQTICAMRLFLPDVGIVLSTREPVALRDGLIPVGVTMMSAGSHTEPGGYTGAGNENVHVTRKGRVLAEEGGGVAVASGTTRATGQFEISDNRTPSEVADQITRLGYEPVWKDWDVALMN